LRTGAPKLESKNIQTIFSQPFNAGRGTPFSFLWRIHKNRHYPSAGGSSDPLAKVTVRKLRPGKLDPFKPIIRELLEQWPRASAVVIGQRIRSLGYTGGRSILQEYLATLRQIQTPTRAYVRIESSLFRSQDALYTVSDKMALRIFRKPVLADFL
jgi:hypothetical protein